MRQERKINFSRPKKEKLQSIWNYIRRNPNFRISEVEMVCEVSSSYLQKYLRALVATKYIVFTSKLKKPFSNREYRLIKNTGVKAPRFLRDGVTIWDENIKKRISLKDVENMKFSDLKRVLKLVRTESVISLDEISTLTRVSKENLSIEIFNKLGIMLNKIADMDDLYVFDSQRADEIVKIIKEENLIKDSDMEFLWKQ